MVEMNEFSEINQNFDTIKTLLNSIRAQGILNTSDVDKLLTGINSKLEKINTDEDIDLIKVFLSELKHNLDERHNMLLSKFGAIESLFSNLLKNSSEMPKSADIKELFDIVATNLSVFSREVVAQKDSLNDINLRLDALRTDDTNKKDIIKNIVLLKPDIERLNNGFDSIVLSLNDNFKTIIKTITSLDNVEALNSFADNMKNIEVSSNTILSALQILDKKTEKVEVAVQNLATKEDLTFSNRKLVEITDVVNDISHKYVRVESLADKVDATVNIIAGMKTVLEEIGDKNSNLLVGQLKVLETELDKISSDTKFDEFKSSLELVLKNIVENISMLDQKVYNSFKEFDKIETLINALDINVNFKDILASISKMEEDVKASINEVSQKLLVMQDANLTRIVNDISLSAESLNARLNQSQSSIAVLCEKNFNSIFENVIELKALLTQIDENNVSANNAIFSSITDRLSLFENSLQKSLNTQEMSLESASIQLTEQIEGIKNLSNVLDYKMDSSVVEVAGVKKEISTLKESLDAVLAIDFVNIIKDLRVDLYATKQDLSNVIENSTNEVSECVVSDLYGKYELIISKLDTVDEGIRKSQAESLFDIKGLLDKISFSIMDILSYVSEKNNAQIGSSDSKLAELSEMLKENSLNYIESVRDVVDVIRVQLSKNIKEIEESCVKKVDSIKLVVSENAEEIKKELRYSYAKLIEIQDLNNELKESFNIGNAESVGNIKEVLAKTDLIKVDVENNLNSIKNSLINTISEFKQEFTCENADKVSELKFAVESLYSKNSKELNSLIEELKEQVKLDAEQSNSERSSALESIIEKIELLKEFIVSLEHHLLQKNDSGKEFVVNKIDSVAELINSINKESSNKEEANLDLIINNFSTIKESIETLGIDSSANLNSKVEVILESFENLKKILSRIDENIDGDMTRQLSIIESNFESLVSQLSILFDKSDKTLSEKINAEFNIISSEINDLLLNKLESYQENVNLAFDGLSSTTKNQAVYLEKKLYELNDSLKLKWDEQFEANNRILDDLIKNIKLIIDENTKLTAVDYVSLNNKLGDFAKNIEVSNQSLTKEIQAKLDDIIKYYDATSEVNIQQINENDEGIRTLINDSTSDIKTDVSVVKTNVDEQLELARESKADLSALIQMTANNNNSVEAINIGIREHHEAILQKNDLILKNTQGIDRALGTVANSVTGIKIDVSSLVQSLLEQKTVLSDLEATISEKVNVVISTINDSAQLEQLTFASSFENILSILEAEKLQIENLREIIGNTLKNEFELITKSIEKETDIIIGDVIEQFEMLKSSQNVEMIDLVSRIEDIINAHVYNNTEDLKSYLDVKVDNSVIISKLDNYKIEVTSLISEALSNLNKMLPSDVFKTSISDFKVANEIIINSAIEKVNSKTIELIGENNNLIEEKLAIFDKNIKEVIVDKYVEIKQISNNYNNSFEDIKLSIVTILNSFEQVKAFVAENFGTLTVNLKNTIEETNKEIRLLNQCFENLRSQISNKSFDEAFQMSINKQLTSLENLISDQLGYLEDINDICLTNLPEVLELNTIVKNNVLTSIQEFSEKIESYNLSSQINETKNEILDLISTGQESRKEDVSGLSNHIKESQKVLLDVVSSGFDSEKSEINNLSAQIEETKAEIIKTMASEFNTERNDSYNLVAQIEESKKDILDAMSVGFDSEKGESYTLSNQIKEIKEDLLKVISQGFDVEKNENYDIRIQLEESKDEIIESLSPKLEVKNFEKDFEKLKTEIITQFINIFNQISFITEQEEILDFIQEKHDELITVLSHIVTTSEEITDIHDNLTIVDNKIDLLKDEIGLLNEKINAIISSKESIDYVYSLDELESDIAKLRMALNDAKLDTKSNELNKLIESTNEIYSLVEFLKQQIPTKDDFDTMAEDIVSISSRTNKLLLASDESYKNLNDNLQDFKMVINDLDERSKNFVKDSGIDKIDLKLNAINSKIENETKTNKIFNQIFEYLAEWVDNASVQIDSISDKVNTLDDIENIKLMLADIKAQNEDLTASEELAEALGSVFEKQTKRILSLESKIDKIIVETTINRKSEKFDTTPFENTLNKFLLAMDEKIAVQENKINSLELKLESAMSLLGEKDSALLTKKIGGMDRQIAKLNKSIEKIASHVVEKEIK